MATQRGPTPPPDAAALQEAALTHLARHGATSATLTRALDRRVDRWARTAEGDQVAAAVAAARRAVRDVVAKLATSGAVDDAAFAESRARRLTRAGRSRRATAAHLAARGITGEAMAAALPRDDEQEFAAAVAFTRRRRFGPFRAKPAEAEDRRRELAAMARAGFQQEAARAALALSPDAAEAVLAKLRQG